MDPHVHRDFVAELRRKLDRIRLETGILPGSRVEREEGADHVLVTVGPHRVRLKPIGDGVMVRSEATGKEMSAGSPLEALRLISAEVTLAVPIAPAILGGASPLPRGTADSFQDLWRVVEEGWPFDREAYPLLPEGNLDAEYSFSLSHVVVHAMKTAGKMAALAEPLAHGVDRGVSQEEARQAAYAIINAIRFAQLTACGPADVLRNVREWSEQNAVGYVPRPAPPPVDGGWSSLDMEALAAGAPLDWLADLREAMSMTAGPWERRGCASAVRPSWHRFSLASPDKDPSASVIQAVEGGEYFWSTGPASPSGKEADLESARESADAALVSMGYALREVSDVG